MKYSFTVTAVAFAFIFLSFTKANADITGTFPVSEYNGHTFNAFVYTTDNDRFTNIYNRIPDTVSMTIPLPTSFNVAINAVDLNPFNFGGMTKMIKKYVANNIVAGDDLGTLLRMQLTYIINFPTTKKELQLSINNNTNGDRVGQIYQVGNTMKKSIIDFVSGTIDNVGKNLGLTPEENDILFTAIYENEIAFNVTKFEFISGTSNKISFTLQKNANIPPDPALKIKLLGVTKSIFDYLNSLFIQNAQYIDGTTVRDMSAITPQIIRISGEGFTPTNNAIKLTPAALNDLTVPSQDLLATPNSFAGSVSNFLGGIWSFFRNLIPYTHGQTIGSGYVIDNINSDNSAGTSVTFNIPTSTPNGVYDVAVGSFNSDWLSTNFKITVTNGNVTVSGSAITSTNTVPSPLPQTSSAAIPAGAVSVIYSCTSVTYSGGGSFTGTIAGSGTTLVGTKCVNTNGTSYVAFVSCPAGYTLYRGASILSLNPGGATTTSRYCIPVSTTTIASTSEPTTPIVSTTTTVVTPPSTPTTTTVPATVSYTCSTGTLSGSTCTITKSTTTSYTCPTSATLSGSSCITTDTVGVSAAARYVNGSAAHPTGSYVYSCTSGYTLRSSNNRCYKNPTTSSATATQSCPAGYTTQGSSCTSTYTPNPTYSCPTGYSLNSTAKTCSKVVSENTATSSTANVWDAIANWFSGLFK